MLTKIGFGMMLLAVVAAASPAARAGGLILNGGFETPQVNHSLSYFAGDPALSPWAIVTGSVDTVPTVPATGTGWPAFEGMQSLDLNGAGPERLSRPSSLLQGRFTDCSSNTQITRRAAR